MSNRVGENYGDDSVLDDGLGDGVGGLDENALSELDQDTPLTVEEEKEVLQGLNVESVDDIPEDQLQTVAETVISSLTANSGFQNAILNPWNALNDEDKVTLYNQGTISNAFKNHFLRFGTWRYDNIGLKFAGDKLAPTFRGLMQVGLLPVPNGISPQQLASDASSDLNSHRVLAMVLPHIPVFKPYAKVLKVLFKINTRLMEVKKNIAINNANISTEA